MDLIGAVIGILFAAIIALTIMGRLAEYLLAKYGWGDWRFEYGWIFLIPLPIMGALIGYLLW